MRLAWQEVLIILLVVGFAIGFSFRAGIVRGRIQRRPPKEPPMNPFTTLLTHQYLNLITYRKSGETVATPVWFVHDNQRLYVMTSRNAGKVKRIRNNPVVQIEPCDARGTRLGDGMTANARVLDVADHARVNQLLNQKYGMMKRLFDFMALFNGGIKSRDFIEITHIS
ncbi:MAG: PPOX class F420-dependent oxidoreductase [Roseiflexaceae bacterium]